MPRNKVLERAKVTAPSGRNPFDDSNCIAAHSLAAEINVVLAQPVIAGTKGKISRRCFTRTADLQVPSFHDVTEHFDFFIVPIHSLWRMWNDWKVNINDMKDTKLVPWNSATESCDLTLPPNCPRLDFLDLVHTSEMIPSSGTLSPLQARAANDCLKLSEAMGYGECVGFAPTPSITARVMNTFIPAAYQKIYFEHYRNTAYESNNPYAYNFDWLYDGSRQGLFDLTNAQDRAVARELFKMRRVNYRNDYFHNIYPALNYVQFSPNGQSFSIPSDIGQLGDYMPPSSDARGRVNVSASSSLSALQINHIGFDYNINTGSISVQSIRAAFALDKLMRASAYAPKHVREQWKALYGVDTVDDPDMRSVRIGSFQSDVVFQEVVSMSNNSSIISPNNQDRLGALGSLGKGGESKDKFINFFAKEDSIIIGLHYYLPRAMYDAYGLHPFNTHIARESFYNKFFENLGLRPFYASYIDGIGFRINQRATPVPNSTVIVVGWSVPNFEHKIRPDLNYGAFKQKFMEFEYNAPSGTTPASITQNTNQTSILGCFVPHSQAVFGRGDNDNVSATNYLVNAEYFKAAPEDLDNVFRVAVPAAHPVSYFQFYGIYRIALLIVAPMSVHGQPSL